MAARSTCKTSSSPSATRTARRCTAWCAVANPLALYLFTFLSPRMTALFRLPRFLLVLPLGFILGASRPVPPAGPRQARELPAFTAVALSTSVLVVVRQGSPQRVEVEALPEDLPKIQTEVTGQQLRIRKMPATTDQSLLGKLRHVGVELSGPVTVYVTLPTVQALSVSSSGQLRVDTLRGREMRLAVSGSGQLRVGQVQASRVRTTLSSSGSLRLRQLQADSLRAFVSGSGSFRAAGACAYSELTLSSSGGLDTGELAVQDCQARLSGSGSARVRVARALDARLSSSGSLL
ncbi:MAG: DUF2807 domain-containing protein, partial [Hymenobacter sp.]